MGISSGTIPSFRAATASFTGIGISFGSTDHGSLGFSILIIRSREALLISSREGLLPLVA
jgi:hypothetical protein